MYALRVHVGDFVDNEILVLIVPTVLATFLQVVTATTDTFLYANSPHPSTKHNDSILLPNVSFLDRGTVL